MLSFKSFLLLFSVLLTACGTNPTSSTTSDVEDIVSMQARADGNFDVVCRNGLREVATPADIRSGRVCDAGGGGASGSFLCVARDNDGRSPWVLGRFTDSGDIVKMPSPLFSTFEACTAAVNASVEVGNSSLVCIARDNDDRDPWIVVSIDRNGNLTRRPTVYATFDACSQTLKSGRILGDSLVSCAARDDDGRNPWILLMTRADGEKRVSGLLYSTLDLCRSTLSSGRNNGSSLLFCIARDNDDRDPWIIVSHHTDATVTRNNGTVFANLSDCTRTLGG